MLESFKKLALICAACAVLLSVVSCGGGGGHGASSVLAANRGALKLSVKWPSRTGRLVPASASFIAVTLTQTHNNVAQTPVVDYLARPGNNNDAVTMDYTVFPNLQPSGTIGTDTYSYIVSVGSFAFDPNPVDGAFVSPGVNNPALSGFSQPLTVATGSVTPLNITLLTDLFDYSVQWNTSPATLAFPVNVLQPTTVNFPSPSSSATASGILTVTPQDVNGYNMMLASSKSTSVSAITVTLATGTPATLTPDANIPPNYTLQVPIGYQGSLNLTVAYTEGSNTVRSTIIPVQFSTNTILGPSVNVINAPTALDAASLTLLDKTQNPVVKFVGQQQQLFLVNGAGAGPSIDPGVVTDGNQLTPAVYGYLNQAGGQAAVPIFTVTNTTAEYLYQLIGAPPTVDFSNESTTSTLAFISSIAPAVKNTFAVTEGSSVQVTTVIIKGASGSGYTFATIPAGDFVFGTPSDSTNIQSISQDPITGVLTVNTKALNLTAAQTITIPVAYQTVIEPPPALPASPYENSALAGTITLVINANVGSGGGTIH